MHTPTYAHCRKAPAVCYRGAKGGCSGAKKMDLKKVALHSSTLTEHTKTKHTKTLSTKQCRNFH